MGRLRSIGNRLRAGGSSTDSDAAAWASAVTANGGTYSAATLTAVDTFVKASKASNYWTKLNRINLFCGNQLAAALVPLKAGGGSATDTNVNFVAGDYTEATGLTGNGSTKYLNTGLVANTLTLSDTHLFAYNRAASAVGGNAALGCRDASANFFHLYAPLSSGNLISRAYDDLTTPLSTAISAPYGHCGGSRTGANAFSTYKQGSVVASDVDASAKVLPAFAIYVFAENDTGSAIAFTSHPLGAYSIGSGLTAGDVTAYNTHMQAFQTALSRQV